MLDFSARLGLTNPCMSATRKETFSTTVFKVLQSNKSDMYLIWIVATTTEICTNDYFTPIYI